MSFFCSNRKVKNIDKDGNESVVTFSDKINFIDSARFMASSKSHFVDNLTEEIHISKFELFRQA